MPKISFLGKVYPEYYSVSIPNFSATWDDISWDLKMKFDIKIQNSEVSIDCHVNRYEPSYIPIIYKCAIDLTRASINTLAFSNGIGHSVILHEFVDDKGVHSPLSTEYRSLASLSTAFNLNTNQGYGEAIQIIMSEPTLFMALDDLIVSITLPHHAVVNCARAIEGIRQMIAPEEKRDAQWIQMHSILKTSESYVNLITDNSKLPRHGNRAYVSAETSMEITNRAWVIMNRFLEFRKRGNRPLPEADFPILL